MVSKSEKQVIMFRNIVIVVVIMTVAGIFLARSLESKSYADSSAITSLAQCLKEKGVKMYGSEWCSNCTKQKKDFGTAFELIDYVECSVPGDPRKQAVECEKAGITSYPTWSFSLGDRVTGGLSFSDLSAKAGCSWGEVADTSPEEFVAPSIELDLSSLDNENVTVEKIELE